MNKPTMTRRTMTDYPPVEFREGTNRFGPRGPGERIMQRIHAVAAVAQTVPYRVSFRFAFYRLWEARDVYFNSRQDKEHACASLHQDWSKAVHGGWYPPDTFADESRQVELRQPSGAKSTAEWLDDYRSSDFESMIQEPCSLDRRSNQAHQVILCFEANAMVQQFQHYAGSRSLDFFPFGGQLSNPIKYDLAKRVEFLVREYPDSQVTVLYAGDFDTAGVQIPETAFWDVDKWCSKPFDVYRIGVNKDHGVSQWEALTDDRAGEIITTALNQFIDLSKYEELDEQETDINQQVAAIISEHTDFQPLMEALEELAE